MKQILFTSLLLIAPHAFAVEVPESVLESPAELAQALNDAKAEKPLLLQVGSRVLYAEAHIPGSEYVGAAGQPAGLKALRERVAKLDRATKILIYCGCCAWKKCPNIRPAYKLLSDMGFTKFKVLNIADNLGENWVAKGYPVAKGR